MNSTVVPGKSEDNWLEALRHALVDTSRAFFDRPGDYLYEADLQAHLLGRLRDRIQPNSVPYRGRTWTQPIPFGIGRVHAEYPTGSRFDIAILSAETRDDRSMWNQPVLAAVELKLWQFDGSGMGLMDDICKLEEWPSVNSANDFTGISLLFVHPNLKPEQYLTKYKSLALSSDAMAIEPGKVNVVVVHDRLIKVAAGVKLSSIAEH